MFICRSLALPVFVLCVLLFFPLLGGLQCSAASAGEIAALSDIYAATDGDNWKNSGNWNVGDPCTNSWYGITCSGGTDVYQLSLTNNNLRGILPSSMSDLTNLMYILLSYNEITAIEPGALAGCVSLIDVYMAYNNLTSIDGTLFPSAVNLDSLFMEGNQITQLPVDVFQGIPTVVDMSFADNMIDTLPAGVLDNLSDLENFDISGNQLTTLSSGVFHQAVYLWTIDLNDNLLSSVAEDAFVGLPRLGGLYLQNNLLTDLGEALLPLQVLYSLLVDHNLLTEVPVHLAPTMTTLYLSDNAITSVTDTTFQGLNDMYTLDLSNNAIQELSAGVFTDMAPALRTLHLSGNPLQTLEVGVFANMVDLMTFSMKDTELTILEAGIFSDMARVYNMDLQGSQISTIEPKVFHNNVILSVLNLQDNNLTTVEPDMLLGVDEILEVWLGGNSLTMFPELNPSVRFVNVTYNHYCGAFPVDLRYNSSFELGYYNRDWDYVFHTNNDCHMGEGNTFFCTGLNDLVNHCGTNVTCVDSCPVPGFCTEQEDPCTAGHTANCTSVLEQFDLEVGVVSRYTCACLPGYTGEFCEEDIDDCLDNPCGIQGASCTDLVNDFSCECYEGYIGLTCEEIDDCHVEPCANNATCTDMGLNAFACDCLPGFNGTLCEGDVNDCLNSSCNVNGTSACVDLGTNAFDCECNPFYTGDLCEVPPSCLVEPCANNGTCVDDTTIAGVFFECLCLPGTLGDLCETDVDECASSPCAAEGTSGCFNLGFNVFECKCLDDWSGAYCEIAASTAYEVVVDYTFGDIDEYVTAVHADLQLEYPGIEILVSAQETASGETILSITFLDWSEEEAPALDELLSAAETVATGSNANNVVSGPAGWDDSDQQEASASTPSVPEIVMVATLAATIVMFCN